VFYYLPLERSPTYVVPVENNALDVYVILRALQQCGIQIHFQLASDGEQALSILRQLEAGSEHELLSLILLAVTFRIIWHRSINIIWHMRFWNAAPVLTTAIRWQDGF
jgi:CheY-like chemotaxis protein